MDYTIILTDEDIHSIQGQAQVFKNSRGGWSSPRLYSDKNKENVVGATGEYAFYLLYKHLGCAPPDTTPRPEGDSGVDFKTPWGTLDVKTSRGRGNLLVKQKDVSRAADVLVQAHLSEQDRKVEFLGWYLGKDLKRDAETQEPKNLKGLICNFVPESQLWPMEELTISFIICLTRRSGRE